jgi:hypothetical protein
VAELEPDRTRTFYEAGPFPLEQTCCLPCAALSVAVQENALPTVFTDFLRKAGVDVRQPQEVWGAPDSGFLAGWYVAAGAIDPTSRSSAAADASVEMCPGFSVRVTAALSMERNLALTEPRVQIEFHWEHKDLRRIASAAEALMGEAVELPSARERRH